MQNIEKLFAILDNQSTVFNDLLELSKNKKDVIVEGKVNELENITKVEQSVVLKLRDLESELEDNIQHIVKDYSIKEKDVNFSVIQNYLQDEHKVKLDEKRKKIYAVIQELDHLNKLNSQLIKSSLDYINFSINLYSNANSTPNGSYEQSGEVKSNKSSFFDAKG